MKTFSEIITFADRPTGSGQIYTETLLDDAFNIYMSKDKHLRHGCLEAPTSGVVDYDKISHYLIDVYWEFDALWGEIEIAEDLPMGKILSSLVEDMSDSLTLGLAAMATFKTNNEVISRNLFAVHKEETSKVVDDLAVITVYVLNKSNTNH